MRGDVSGVAIDIDCQQLLDWLIDRRHCRRDYQSQLNKLKQQINSASSHLDQERKECVQKSEILTYYHIQRLFDQLSQTESTDKTLFGGYASPVLSALHAVLKSYESNNLYLADAATVLGRLQVYEVPFVRKSMTKLKVKQLELQKQLEDLAKKQEESMASFNADCSRYGVKGEDLRAELLSLTDGLSTVFSSVALEIQGLQPYCDLYDSFCESNGEKSGSEFLSTVKYIIKHGNTSLHAYFNDGQESEALPEASTETGGSAENDEGGGIDWGDDTEETGAEIDYGICIDTEAAIDFTIEVVDDVTVSNSGIDNRRVSVLENRDTRLSLLSDLNELGCFLKVRKLEMDSSSDAVQTSTLTIGEIGTGLKLLSKVVDDLTCQRTRDLLLMLADENYVEKLVHQVSAKRRQAVKYQQLAESCEVLLQESKTEEASLKPRKQFLEKECEFIKQRLEKSISKLYDNRPVCIYTQ